MATWSYIFVPDFSASPKDFYLLYAGDTVVALSRGHRHVNVELVDNNGAPALAGCSIVGMLHAAADFSTEAYVVETSHQPARPIWNHASFSAPPLALVTLEAVLSDTPAPATLI